VYSYQVMCDRCGLRAENLWPQWACYLWPTGNTTEIAQHWVWCGDCGSITVGEALRSVAQMDRLLSLPVIAQAYDGEKKVWRTEESQAVLDYACYPRLTNLYEHLRGWKRWDGKQSIVMLNTLNLHRQWRLDRVSPPRCLTCGGIEITPIQTTPDGEPSVITHPTCGGTIYIARMEKVRGRRLLWTTEGIAIGLG
jgi:hypothetical protein